MVDGTELHLRLEDDKLTLAGKDHPGVACSGTRASSTTPPAPDRWIELCPKTGNRLMPPSRPVKRLFGGELTELDRQHHDLYERGWIECSTTGHAAAAVFVQNPDGSWRLCYDYRGLNAITEPLVEPLLHINTLLEQTRGWPFS